MCVNNKIASRLKELMHAKGVTVKNLSNKTGLARGTISNIRNGKNHYTWQLKLICDELGVSLSAFMDDTPSPAHTRAVIAVQKIKSKRLAEIISIHIESLNNLN